MKRGEFARWVRTVGAERARMAATIRQLRPSDTLPELLAQAWLRERGIEYEPQVELGVLRLDVVVFDHILPDTGEVCALGWAVQGERWHAGKQAHDEAKFKQAINQVVRGQRICDVIPIWERDIYDGPTVLMDAWLGARWRY